SPAGSYLVTLFARRDLKIDVRNSAGVLVLVGRGLSEYKPNHRSVLLHLSGCLRVMHLKQKLRSCRNPLNRAGLHHAGIHTGSKAYKQIQPLRFFGSVQRLSSATVLQRATVIIDRHAGLHAHQEAVAAEYRFLFGVRSILLDLLLSELNFLTVLGRRL